MDFYSNQAGGIIGIDTEQGISLQLSNVPEIGGYIFVQSSISPEEAGIYLEQYHKMGLTATDFSGKEQLRDGLVSAIATIQSLKTVIG